MTSQIRFNLAAIISLSLLSYFFFFILNVECHHNEIKNTSNSNTSVLMKLFRLAENALETTKHYVIHNIRYNHEINSNAMDCAEILKKDSSAKNGLYKIYPRNRIVRGPINVYCDMDDDGGGWTVLQRRGNFDSAQDYFFRDWSNYKNGFGDLLKDFWIGNDNIFALTNEEPVCLKFNLWDWDDNFTYALYDNFWMDDEDHKYAIHVSGFRGTAGDSFTFANGVPFTTKDNDNDKYENNCALLYKGAWWYTACHHSNLNGLYLKGKHESYADGVDWTSWKGHHYSLKTTEIKIRPKDFPKRGEEKVKKDANVNETPM